MAFASGQNEKVSEQCQDNPYGFNGVVVFGDEAYGMTQGCMPDMTGYNQYLTRRGNGFSAGAINADRWNNARASRQILTVNVAVTVSANTRNQPGGRHLDPPFTDGYALQPFYGWGGNRSQLHHVSEQCQDNPYGFNGVVVFGDEAYGMTQGCMPDMTGYNQYLTRRGNGFSAGAINADHWNNARASRQILTVNVSVTVSANTRNQPGGLHLDPPFTDGYAFQPFYGWGGNRSQLWDRDEQHEEEEWNLRLKEKKKKSGSKRKKRSRHGSR